ncbi:MAG: hypothetical protein ACE5H8_06120, partial [Alphaproteobacteria bacterium]
DDRNGRLHRRPRPLIHAANAADRTSNVNLQTVVKIPRQDRRQPGRSRSSRSNQAVAMNNSG